MQHASWSVRTRDEAEKVGRSWGKTLSSTLSSGMILGSFIGLVLCSAAMNPQNSYLSRELVLSMYFIVFSPWIAVAALAILVRHLINRKFPGSIRFSDASPLNSGDGNYGI